MNNKLILAVTITFFVFSCTSKQDSETSLPENFAVLDSLLQNYNEGDTLGSLQGMEVYVKKFPESDYGYNFLAILYLAVNDDSLAMISTVKALQLNPENYSALTNHGILLDKKGEHDQAYEYYLRALDFEPEYVQAYSNLMGNRIAVKDLQSARNFGEKAVVYGNNITDKGLLCALYHKLNLTAKRDSLLEQLESENYKNVSQLKDLFD